LTLLRSMAKKETASPSKSFSLETSDVKTSNIPTFGANHHWLPQFYLRQWASDEDDNIWVYPVDGPKPFKTSPRAVAAEKGLYDPTPSTELKRRDTERQLAEIEATYAKVWPNIFKQAGDFETRKNLARFLATLWLRSPERRRAAAAAHRRVYGPRGVLTDKRAIQDTFLFTMKGNNEWLAGILAERRWGILFTDDAFFITSDSPVVLTQGHAPDSSGFFDTPGTHVSFAISPKLMLFIDDSWQSEYAVYPLIDREGFNNNAILAAQRFVFSHEESQKLQTLIVDLRWRSGISS
jgi:Protein of unknown function (DUF4238)